MEVEKRIFINILQGKTGRWIEGESVGYGLYTDEVTTCKIFLFFGEKNGKRAISMTHYDGYTNVADIEQEKNWFDKVTHCCICLKPEKALKGAFEEFFDVLKDELKKRNIQFNIANITVSEDAVIANYKGTESNIVWVDSAKFEEYIGGLINHPQACKMYAYYKMNVMFSEIEGEIKYNAEFYKKKN